MFKIKNMVRKKTKPFNQSLTNKNELIQLIKKDPKKYLKKIILKIAIKL